MPAAPCASPVRLRAGQFHRDQIASPPSVPPPPPARRPGRRPARPARDRPGPPLAPATRQSRPPVPDKKSRVRARRPPATPVPMRACPMRCEDDPRTAGPCSVAASAKKSHPAGIQPQARRRRERPARASAWRIAPSAVRRIAASPVTARVGQEQAARWCPRTGRGRAPRQTTPGRGSARVAPIQSHWSSYQITSRPGASRSRSPQQAIYRRGGLPRRRGRRHCDRRRGQREWIRGAGPGTGSEGRSRLSPASAKRCSMTGR